MEKGILRVTGLAVFRSLIILPIVLITGCVANGKSACAVTEPVWDKPPEDSAVSSTPEDGYYFVNKDHSIWASAWWTGQGDNYLNASEEGIKVGWFRPSGAELEITGRRIDAEVAPLEADIPCCYPTRFQATGLYFPAGGCWEITEKAEDSLLTFVLWVEP